MYNQYNIKKSAVLLKAIGHPIRIKIILTLANNKELTVTELSNYLSIDQPIMSFHLAILRKQLVVALQKKGKKSSYYICDKSVKQAVNIIYNTRVT